MRLLDNGRISVNIDLNAHTLSRQVSAGRPGRGARLGFRTAVPRGDDAVTIAFKQPIGATQPLRTGAYSKMLTFTLSTTTP